MKILYLTSSLNANYEITKDEITKKYPCKIDNAYHILDCLKKDIKEPLRFVMLASNPNAYEINDMYADLIKQSFVMSGFCFDSFVCVDDRNKDGLASYIKSSNFVYLSGGHVPTENKFFGSINLKEILETYTGIIMGVSAGSMNMAKTVYAQPEEEGEAVNANYVLWLNGLNLCDISILPHYENIKNLVKENGLTVKEMTEKDSFTHTIYTISDSSFIRVEDDNPEFYGEVYEVKNGENRLVGYKKDMHIHTKYSDGEFDENAIIEEVKNCGIKEFCICDHDTIEGSKRVCELVKNNYADLTFHSGIEISCKITDMFGGINVHVLARDFDYTNKHILSFVEEMKDKRIKKAYKMAEQIEELYDIKLPKEELDNKLKITNSFGKPHIYSLLLEYKNVDRKQFFDDMNKYHNADLKLDIYDVIAGLKEDNCQITLAHPKEIMKENNLTYQDIELLVKHLTKYGINALETKHSIQTHEDNEIFSQIAKKYGLTETCGSDFHGPTVKPKIKLGMIYKD